MDANLKITLMGIQNEMLRQITIEQRAGRAVQEEELDPEPTFEEHDQPDQDLLQNTTLEQLVSGSTAKNPQIDMEEAIENAQVAETATPAPKSEDTRTYPTLRERISAYLDARREWHVKRMAQDYSYGCRKQQVIDRTYGFQFVVEYIDTLIKKIEAEEKKQFEAEEKANNRMDLQGPYYPQ